MRTSARLAVLALGLLGLVAAAQYPQHRRFDQPNLPRGGAVAAPVPWLQFAPTAGTGLTASCAGTTITGTAAEVVTVTRTSAANCSTAGMARTGLTPGVLVMLASGTPRVEPDLDGVAGVRIEPSRQNLALRSEQLGTAPWNKSADVTRNLDQGPGLDGGAAQSDEFVFNSGAAAESAAYQGFTSTAATYSTSTYARGMSGSATFDFCTWVSTTPGANGCTAASVVSATWNRFVATKLETATAWYLEAGCEKQGNTSACTTNPDVLLWGMQKELGGYASSYIPTLGTAVTRAADTYAIAPASNWTGATIDAAVYWSAPTVITASAVLFSVYKDANNSVTASIDGSAHLVCTWNIGGTPSTVTTSGTLTVSASQRARCYYDGANRAACIGSTCATTAGALTLPTGTMTAYVGSDNAGANQGGGIYSRLAIGPMGVNP